MDENEAIEVSQAATPIFNVYRRGYDPEQVDRYVADQQRRLDDALHRAGESERRLAAAVGQLRELHRRVAAYENESRTVQAPALDTLGERVQRILQEAWEGAFNLRQEAEREVTELRETAAEEVAEMRRVASAEAAEIIDLATRRALAIRDETERRRQAYLSRIEQDRERAVSQITYLYDQRQGAIAELARLQATVGATVEEMARSPLGRPAPGVAAAVSPLDIDGSPMLPLENPERANSGEHEERLADVRTGSRAGAERQVEDAGTSQIWDVPTAEQPAAAPARVSRETEGPAPRRANKSALFDAEQEGWT